MEMMDIRSRLGVLQVQGTRLQEHLLSLKTVIQKRQKDSTFNFAG